MILEIDTKFLIRNNITAHQFLILKYASMKEYDALKGYLTSSGTFTDLHEDIRKLYNAGFLVDTLSAGMSFRDIKPSPKFIQMITYTGDPFDEFHNAFPTKALRPDGNYDYLRVDRNRCRKLYHNIVKVNKTMHDHLMHCLRLEVEDRNANGKMSYMKRMPTWLTSEAWKVYEDRINNDTTSGDITTQKGGSYGTKVE